MNRSWHLGFGMGLISASVSFVGFLFGVYLKDGGAYLSTRDVCVAAAVLILYAFYHLYKGTPEISLEDMGEGETRGCVYVNCDCPWCKSEKAKQRANRGD